MPLESPPESPVPWTAMPERSTPDDNMFMPAMHAGMLLLAHKVLEAVAIPALSVLSLRSTWYLSDFEKVRETTREPGKTLRYILHSTLNAASLAALAYIILGWCADAIQPYGYHSASVCANLANLA